MLVLAVLFAAVAPRPVRLGFEYRKGGTWNYETLYAPFDFPVLKTSEQIQSEIDKASDVYVPYYDYSEDITRSRLNVVPDLDLGPLTQPVFIALRNILERGVVADDALPENSDVIYVHRNKRAVKKPSSEILGMSAARSRLLADVKGALPGVDVDSVLRAKSVYSLVTPNLFFDAQTSDAVNAEAVNRISPTIGYITAGQLIVSNGEIITAEIARILDSYKKEYEANVGYSGPAYLSILGNLLAALLLVGLFALAIIFSSSRFFEDSRYYYTVFVFALVVLTIRVLSRFDSKYLFVAPLTLGALYLQAFVRARVIVPLYIISLLPLLIYPEYGAMLYVVFLSGGMVAIYGSRHLTQGWRQFLLALATFAAMSAAYAALRLAGVAGGVLWQDLLRLLIASVLAIAGFPLIYLFEIVFNLVSNSRLAELSDTSSGLLRELESKAPGTFQHSLQVMNMADAAARATDANPLLLRVGALYHDIGKLNNPMCFVENESILNKSEERKYHAGLSPQQSAEDIIRHVGDGVELARKNRLPDVVIDFIRTHHGTTVTGYFWSKYIADGGSREDRSRFTYPGPAPVTKEQIILMLCDSIEAASRTLTDYSPESFSAFVERIVKEKMDQEQFANADISIKELNKVKDAIKAYLAQMHHGRVAYPAQRKKILKIK